MGEPGESKRDQAVKALCKILASVPYRDVPLVVFVDLVIDAAKEEIRAELAEQEEEDRWHWMNLILGLCDGPQSPAFWEEYGALKAKRAVAGKSTE